MRIMRLFSFLALIAIAVRAMTPAGYMVGVDEETGLVRMEICHGGVGASVSSYWLDAKTGELIEGGQLPTDDAPTDPCPYASLTMMDLPSDIPAFDHQQIAYRLGDKPIARDVLVQKPRRTLPPLRGPPLHV